jgi:hypothetical protein
MPLRENLQSVPDAVLQIAIDRCSGALADLPRTPTNIGINDELRS